MEHRNIFHLMVSFTLFSVFYLRAKALPPLGTYSNSRLGNRLSFEGENEGDHTQGTLKQDTDILQNTLPENDKYFLNMAQGVGRISRHADGLFTSGYSKLLGQLSARRYLESLIGKRVSNSVVEDPVPVKRHSDAVFTDNYSRFRKQMAVKKYLNSVLTGKRSQEDINPSSLREDADLSQSPYSENYDDATIDELLNHLPLSLIQLKQLDKKDLAIAKILRLCHSECRQDLHTSLDAPWNWQTGNSRASFLKKVGHDTRQCWQKIRTLKKES